jgi:hypothetical protein
MQRFRACVSLIIKNLLAVSLGLLLLAQSITPPADRYEQVRAYTRMREFDYVLWTLEALGLKFSYASLSAPAYINQDRQRELVYEYLALVKEINQLTREVETIYIDPNVKDPAQAASGLEARLAALKDNERQLQPLAEAVLQNQVSAIIAEQGLGIGGQPIPPVLYHVTRLPHALIVSPRNKIEQEFNISLLPEITVEEMAALESDVENQLDVSALVVGIGGVGTYPTMVMSTTNLPYLLEVIAHEWVHNYLTLRPLGVNYMTTPQLRTINETTANIAGKELGRAVLDRYYPDIAATLPPLDPPAPPVMEEPEPQQPDTTPVPEDPAVFNFNREMRTTRLQVDELLAAGKIEEAEQYMEQRRVLFWEQGYRIRRLNQAYFAFHGAYSDAPGGGAGGRDPAGPAVQMLRYQSKSLVDFLYRISWISSFDQLQTLIQE